ncbi:MAG TPA: nickel pincer cofactor biosynthesis protein LarC [Ktedonobacteraceae bacterium]|nr:nickel pincer cofactor biosynthesis protein LarC [Ktedonobacteraceae bacterium]
MEQGKKTLYLDCQSGISGDMFLGALLDLKAGFSLEMLRETLATLPLSGYELVLHPFEDKGIRGSRFDVRLAGEDQPTRHLSDIVNLLRMAQLPARICERAIAIFRCLAEAEAAVHGTSIEEVHFHEVGAVDAIIDIAGAALAVETLGIEEIFASPLPLTSGHVKTAHGLLPVPAPATLEILRRVHAPWRPFPVEGELVTPTGAAILATLARFETPPMVIEQVGYGFGKKIQPWPNCLRACLGPASFGRQAAGADVDWVTVIETNIDNMPGELLGGLMERVLAAGALDVAYIPIQMKKNRPAVMISVICSPEKGEALAQVILRETSTLGVRMRQMQRLKAQRIQQRIETPLGPMLVKVKRLEERVLSATPEYEECERIARERALPLQAVYEVARQAIASAIIGEGKENNSE